MKEYVNGSVFIKGKLVKKNFVITNGKIYFNYSNASGEQVDLADKVVAHGFIDVHTHARIPGFSYKEDQEHLTAAALAGGYTKLVLMANVSPAPIDTYSYLEVQNEVSKIGVEVLQAARATWKGKPVNFGELSKFTKIYSDDGEPIESARLMAEVLYQAKKHNGVVMLHEEDHSLKGCAYESSFTSKIGLPSFGPEYETEMVKRDIALNEGINAHIHLQHISVAKSLRYLAFAKKMGMHITAEVSPHHLFFNNEDLENHGNYRMNPPIGSKEDQDDLIAAVKSGLVEIIATDHAPHAKEEKDVEFVKALNGVIGLETAFAAVHTKLTTDYLEQILSCLTIGPAKLLGESGEIKEGSEANIVIIDPDKKWTFTASDIKSKASNSPWIGKEFIGKVEKVIYKDKEFCN